MDKDRADILCKLAESANKSFERRAAVEWKVSLSLWTSVAVFAGLLVRGEIKIAHLCFFRFSVAAIMTLIVLVYTFCWTRGLFLANKHDKTLATFFWSLVEQEAEVKDSPRKGPKTARFMGDWSHQAQVVFTLILCALAVAATFAVDAAPPK